LEFGLAKGVIEQLLEEPGYTPQQLQPQFALQSGD
jgi:hypothetical protein